MSIQLQEFIDTYRPGGNLRTASQEKVARYENHLPGSLLELWEKVGFGHYGDGLIQIVDPDIYRDTLWGWLMREEEDMSRPPIAISAFGDMFYYRKLSEKGDEDVAFIDPHTSESDVTVWSLEDFFNEWCCDEEIMSDFLEEGMFREAVSTKGELEHDEVFMFVPALRLGGSRSVENMERGNAPVHLDLLLQLALDS
jgi:hypothetical protein